MRDINKINAQFADWLDKKTTKGLNFNDSLYQKRDFYNPSMASKLLDYAGLVECQTNLPKTVYDPDAIPPFDFKRIAANQNEQYEEEMRHRQRSVRQG